MKKPLIQKLGLLGLVSFLSYTAAVLLSPRAGKRKHPSPRKRRCPRLQFKPQRPRPPSAPAAASDAWKAVSDKTGKAFGSVKIAFDACCVALAVALSFILCGEILEVREGTLVAALLTGVFVNLFGRLFTSFGNAESPAV